MAINSFNSNKDTLKMKTAGVVITFLCIFVYSFSGTNQLNDFLMNIYGSGQFWDKYLDPIYYSIFFVLFGIVYRQELLRNIGQIRIDGKKGVFYIVLYFLMIIGAIVISSILMYVFHIGISENQKAIESAFEANMILSSVVTIGLGPFVEEMLFRFHIFNLLRGSRGRRTFIAIIVSSICFALYHTTFISIFSMNFGEAMTLLPYFTIGIVLACLRVKTENLIYPVILHMIYNFMATVAS